MGNDIVRARRLFLVCYPESCDINLAIMESAPDAFAWILHDMDILESTNEPKKPHYHVFLEFENPRSFESVAKCFCIASNQIEKAKSKRGCVRYLIHKDNPLKHQYDSADIVFRGLDVTTLLADKISEDDKAPYLIDLILKHRFRTSFSELCKIICAEGLYSCYRRNPYMFNKIYKDG